MRFSEIIAEDSDVTSDTMVAQLATILSFIQSQYDKKQKKPVVSTNSVVKLMQKVGFANFSYNDLVALNDADVIKNLIKNFNKDTVELSTDVEHNDDDSSEAKFEQEPEEVVADMAKRSMKNHK